MAEVTLQFIANRLDQLQVALELMGNGIEQLKDDNRVTTAMLQRLENNIGRNHEDTARLFSYLNRIGDRVTVLES